MSISAQILHYKNELKKHGSAKLVAVSKFQPNTAIEEAYLAGQRLFGENKAQEMQQKASSLPKDIEWHFIGHLQTNKVKYIAPFVNLIHAVDSLNLLKTIHKEADKNNRTINCLLQIHVAKEETKFGFNEDELKQFISEKSYSEYPLANICGIMGMASNTTDKGQIEQEFDQILRVFNYLKENHFKEKADFEEISMGMSNDWEVAISKGATLIRIGSSIFRQ